jgi:hypothetical protein
MCVYGTLIIFLCVSHAGPHQGIDTYKTLSLLMSGKLVTQCDAQNGERQVQMTAICLLCAAVT